MHKNPEMLAGYFCILQLLVAIHTEIKMCDFEFSENVHIPKSNHKCFNR